MTEKEIKEEYKLIKESYNNNKSNKLISIDEARDNKFTCDWDIYNPIQPTFEGIRYFDNIPVEEIIDYIDWTPFFNAWGFNSRYPKVLEKNETQKEAQRLLDDGKKLLNQAIKEK